MHDKTVLVVLNLLLALIGLTLRIIIMVWFYYAISDIRQDVHQLTWEGKQCKLPTTQETQHE